MMHAFLIIPIVVIIFGWMKSLPPVLGTRTEIDKTHAHVHVVNNLEQNPNESNDQFSSDEDDNFNTAFGTESNDSANDWMFDPAQSYMIGNIYHHSDDD